MEGHLFTASSLLQGFTNEPKSKITYWQDRAILFTKDYGLSRKDSAVLFRLYKKDSDLMDRIVGYIREGKKPSNPIAFILYLKKLWKAK